MIRTNHNTTIEFLQGMQFLNIGIFSINNNGNLKFRNNDLESNFPGVYTWVLRGIDNKVISSIIYVGKTYKNVCKRQNQHFGLISGEIKRRHIKYWMNEEKLIVEVWARNDNPLNFVKPFTNEESVTNNLSELEKVVIGLSKNLYGNYLQDDVPNFFIKPFDSFILVE